MSTIAVVLNAHVSNVCSQNFSSFYCERCTGDCLTLIVFENHNFTNVGLLTILWL